jgi:hypothetical protein
MRAFGARWCRVYIEAPPKSKSKPSPQVANTPVTFIGQQEGFMSIKAIEHHRKAAEHHEQAARHHKEAARHHESGKHETAAHHAHLARGHHEYAMHHAGEAAKAHVEDHGKAKTATA